MLLKIPLSISDNIRNQLILLMLLTLTERYILENVSKAVS